MYPLLLHPRFEPFSLFTIFYQFRIYQMPDSKKTVPQKSFNIPLCLTQLKQFLCMYCSDVSMIVTPLQHPLFFFSEYDVRKHHANRPCPFWFTQIIFVRFFQSGEPMLFSHRIRPTFQCMCHTLSIFLLSNQRPLYHV